MSNSKSIYINEAAYVEGLNNGTVTNVSAGDGLDFTDITTTGSVSLGLPGTLTSGSTNSVSTLSHLHEISASSFVSGTEGILVVGNRFILDPSYINEQSSVPLYSYTGITSNQNIGILPSDQTLGIVYMTNNGTVDGEFSLGTTSSGNEISLDVPINVASGETISITVNIRLSNTEDKTLWVNSDNWANITLDVEWSKITYQDTSSIISPNDLPIASDITLGGVIVGDGLSVDGTGTLSVINEGLSISSGDNNNYILTSTGTGNEIQGEPNLTFDGNVLEFDNAGDKTIRMKELSVDDASPHSLNITGTKGYGYQVTPVPTFVGNKGGDLKIQSGDGASLTVGSPNPYNDYGGDGGDLLLYAGEGGTTPDGYYGTRGDVTVKGNNISLNSTYVDIPYVLRHTNNNGTYMKFDINKISFFTDSSIGLHINEDGKLGINTVFPEKSLHIVDSGIKISGNAKIESTGDDDESRLLVDSGDSNAHVLGLFKNDARDVLKINGNGIVTDGSVKLEGISPPEESYVTIGTDGLLGTTPLTPGHYVESIRIEYSTILFETTGNDVIYEVPCSNSKYVSGVGTTLWRITGHLRRSKTGGGGGGTARIAIMLGDAVLDTSVDPGVYAPFNTLIANGNGEVNFTFIFGPKTSTTSAISGYVTKVWDNTDTSNSNEYFERKLQSVNHGTGDNIKILWRDSESDPGDDVAIVLGQVIVERLVSP
jgi:hypothetical protein